MKKGRGEEGRKKGGQEGKERRNEGTKGGRKIDSLNGHFYLDYATV